MVAKNADGSVINHKITNRRKGLGVDNWTIFYTFSSEVSQKPGFRNN